jgi:hypothetical protein
LKKPLDSIARRCYSNPIINILHSQVKIFKFGGSLMNQMPGRCPVCSSALTVTRLQCGTCGTGIDGAFGLGRLQALSTEQVQFVETFIKCRGKIKDVEAELGISYPTVVSRLNDVVRAMGYEVSEADMSDVDQFEFYQAQAIGPNAIPPGAPFAPGVPAPRQPAPPAPPRPPAGPRLTPEQKQQVLDDLAAGKLSIDEAMKKLNS